jgi:hypothetical protein
MAEDLTRLILTNLPQILAFTRSLPRHVSAQIALPEVHIDMSGWPSVFVASKSGARRHSLSFLGEIRDNSSCLVPVEDGHIPWPWLVRDSVHTGYRSEISKDVGNIQKFSDSAVRLTGPLLIMHGDTVCPERPKTKLVAEVEEVGRGVSWANHCSKWLPADKS